DGTGISANTPVTASGFTSAVSISTGPTHACVLLEIGALKCWGWNSFGNLGDGTQTQRLAPVDVKGGNWVNVPSKISGRITFFAEPLEGIVVSNGVITTTTD